jgi:hypothetical protein
MKIRLWGMVSHWIDPWDQSSPREEKVSYTNHGRNRGSAELGAQRGHQLGEQQTLTKSKHHSRKRKAAENRLQRRVCETRSDVKSFRKNLTRLTQLTLSGSYPDNRIATPWWECRWSMTRIGRAWIPTDMYIVDKWKHPTQEVNALWTSPRRGGSLRAASWIFLS